MNCLLKESIRFPRVLVTFFSFIFLFVTFFSIYNCSGIFMRMHAPQVQSEQSMLTLMNCFSADAQGGCPMNINEHIAVWRGILAATLQMDHILILGVLLALGATISLFSKDCFTFREYAISNRLWCYEHNHKDVRLYDYLIDFFSDGIIQPKLFA